MKVPPENWHGALEWLPRWDGVSPAARAAWLTLKPTPGTGLLPPRLADELAAAGLVSPPGPKGAQHKVVTEAKPLLRVLRAMDRVPVFDVQRGPALAYIREHLTHEQVNLLNGDGRSPGWGSNVGELEERVSSAGWIRALLDLRDADAARKWEMPRRPASEPLLLADPWVLAALQRLVKALEAHPEGVPLRQVDELLPDVYPQHRAGALAAGARYLFLFPALRKQGSEPWMGLLPDVARRLGPPPPPPEPVQARETFEAPFRLADMTAVAVEAATAPIPLRASDYSLYVRSLKTIAARLASLPSWAQDFLVTQTPEEEMEDEDEEPVLDRIANAVGLLSALKLMQMRSTGGRHQFVLTRAGERWLAQGEGERLKEVLDAFRASTQRVPGSWYDGSGKVDFFGTGFPFSLPATGLDVRRPLADAFLSVPPGAMVPLLEFVSHEARARNPLLAASGTLRDAWGNMPKTSEGWEAAWASLLMGFLFLRLAPFAGARLGRLDGDLLAFGLTDAGRYLLGGRDDFALAPAAEGGEVVVQPDFEIVFLAPAPRAEAELGRIAERTGAAGVGALFRLTRASVLRAAEQGMSGAKVLATLETVSRGGVPANVARQVRDWMNAVRTIRIAPAVLVHCPDAETAGRVRALGGAHVAEVTPTLLRLEADNKTRAALVKRLRDKGIFVASG